MPDYDIFQKGKRIVQIRENHDYDEKFIEQMRAGVRARMKEEGCDTFVEFIDKLREKEFQEEIYKRQRLKALGLL